MPTVISTSTFSEATRAFNQRKVDRNQDGTLWSFSTDAISPASVTPRYSKDNGATWTAVTALPGVLYSSLFIDLDDYAHVVWTQLGGTGPNGVGLNNASIYYMRGTPNLSRTAWTWSTAVLLNDSTAGTGLGPNFPDVVACRTPGAATWDAFTVHSASVNAQNFAIYVRVRISADGTTFTKSGDGLGLQGNNTYGGFTLGGNYGVQSAHTFPSIDFNHTGDGKTVAGGTPHLYVGWNAGATGAGLGVRFRKAVYSAGAWTWNAEREIDSTLGASNPGYWQQGSFDGSRFIIAGFTFFSTNAAERLFLIERDAADTTTTTRYNAAETNADVLLHGSHAYDALGNVYLFGRDALGSTRKLNYRKWTRATATLGPIVTFDTTGPDSPYVSAKRGYSANSIDWVYTDGTTSPYSVTFERLALPPLTPYVPAIML